MNDPQQAHKLLIGLTGNIATGKSAIMRLGAEQGALTIDADGVVHEILANDPSMQAAVAVAFGSEVRKANGRIDRAALGQIVFNDPDALRDLELLLHPAVRTEILRRIEQSSASVVMLEAIKLLEGGLAELCRQIWVTRCPQPLQIDRLRVCRGMDLETAVARIKAQSPQEEKVAQADVVIDTGGLMRDTEAQFQLAWQRLPASRDLPHRQAAPPPPAPRLRETQAAPPLVTPKPIIEPVGRPEDLQVRRARPSDIPSILLLIQRATQGSLGLKRADLLRALGERSYFIGQLGLEISAVIGWNIDSGIGRVEQVYIYPLDQAGVTATAVLQEIELSANKHICEAILAFIPQVAPLEVGQLFHNQGYYPNHDPINSLPRSWQLAISESQPENSSLLIKVLRQRPNKR